MSLIKTKKLLTFAQKKKVAIIAFNTANLEIMQAVVRAAEKKQSPIIIEISQGIIKYAGLENISSLAVAMIKNAGVPIGLHLDHSSSFFQIQQAASLGFSSFMFDAGHLPFEENVKQTKKIVVYLKKYHLAVEGELGEIASTQDNTNEALTDPQLAKDYVKKTGVDFLAVSIGSIHKLTAKTVSLDLERLRAIKKTVKIPLVLHGSTGVEEKSLQQAIKLGISKINIASALHQAFIQSLRQHINDDPKEIDFRKKLFPLARQAVQEVAENKIEVAGSAGMAKFLC